MEKSELIETLAKANLADLGDVFKLLAERIYQHRKTHNGFAPREIFAFCVGIGGIYPCVEIVIKVTDKFGRLGYALKKRSGASEQSWENLYQIPGVTGRITDDPNAIFDRLSEEIFGHEIRIGNDKIQGYKIDIKNEIGYLGCEIHDEPERLATCWTLVYQLKITPSIAETLPGEWLIFTPSELSDERIIEHHRNTLRWADDPNHPLFVDLRTR